MKNLWNLWTFPFSLPVSPLWYWLGMGLIGFIAFKLAYYLTGEIGGSNNEMRILHWLIRAGIFLVLWSLACGGIHIIRISYDVNEPSGENQERRI